MSGLTQERAVLARAGDDMDLGGSAALILQALRQARLGKGIFGQQPPKVHLDGVFKNDVMLVCHQNVMNEAKGSTLETAPPWAQHLICTAALLVMLINPHDLGASVTSCDPARSIHRLLRDRLQSGETAHALPLNILQNTMQLQ